MTRKILLLLVSVYVAIDVVYSSADVMKTLSKNYAQAIDQCKQELNAPDSVIQDLWNFWNEDYVMTDRLAGCVLHCLGSKLNIIDPDGNLHHGNTKEFAMKHGADESMAQQLIDIFHGCEKSVPADNDQCVRCMNVAMCFKKEIHKLNWTPNMDLVVGEVLSEM